jgi:hypothetical protein
MSNPDYFPGFEPPVLIGSNWTGLAVAAPVAPVGKEPNSFPVSTRKTPTSDLKSVLSFEADEGLRLAVNGESPTGSKGIDNRETLRISEGAPVFTMDGENLPAGDEQDGRETPYHLAKGPFSNRNLPNAPRASIQSTPSRSSAFAFRAQMFARSLSPTRRAEIERRPRFRNQPWLRRANEPDDFLP